MGENSRAADAALPCYAHWYCCALAHIELQADKCDDDQAKKHKESNNTVIAPWVCGAVPLQCEDDAHDAR